MVYTLVYVSAASHRYSEEELEGILNVARTNNTSLGVSGLLLYSDGNILQVLEGDKDTVEALYEKIAKDPRHKRIFRVMAREFEERNFADWSMGYRRLNPSVLANAVPGFNTMMEGGVFLNSASISRSVWNLMKQFRQQNRPALS